MKIKDTYLLNEIEGENIVITIGDTSETFNGYLKLNQSSKYLWTQLQEELRKEVLVDRFKTEYHLDDETALTDVTNFLTILKEVNALE